MSGGSSSICRINKNQNYTIMSNYHLRSKNLSLKAIGLLSKVFSLPDDWDYSISGLVAICKESETAVKNALNELKEWGYLKVTKTQDAKTGYFVYIYDFFEQSEKDIPKTVPPAPKKSNGRRSFSKDTVNDVDTSFVPCGEKHALEVSAPDNPEAENPVLDMPVVEKRGQLNTKESNTNKLNTNKLNTHYNSAEKKTEKEKYAESVMLSEKEYETLCSELGKEFTEECIDVLNNYKLANGRKYKSDYHAIRSWVIGRVSQKHPAQKNSSNNTVKYYADDENPFADVR